MRNAGGCGGTAADGVERQPPPAAAVTATTDGRRKEEQALAEAAAAEGGGRPLEDGPGGGAERVWRLRKTMLQMRAVVASLRDRNAELERAAMLERAEEAAGPPGGGGGGTTPPPKEQAAAADALAGGRHASPVAQFDLTADDSSEEEDQYFPDKSLSARAGSQG